MSDEISVWNHFLPQHYLRIWSGDGQTVYAHELLVPHENVPSWRPQHIRGAGAHQHLYTSIVDPERADAFERWLNTEVEQPAIGTLEKLRDGKRLTRAEWCRLTMYVFALDQRTPSGFMALCKRYEAIVPQLLDGTLGTLGEPVGQGELHTRELDAQAIGVNSRLPMKLTISDSPEDDGRKILRVEMTAGRELWLWTMRTLLPTAGRRLAGSVRWSVVHPAKGLEWFTSDHPVMRLAYVNEKQYDFEGGWGQPRAEIMLPISPEIMLYTMVKQRWPREFSFTRDLTLGVQRLLKKRALRTIYARSPQESLNGYRRVDAELYKQEQLVLENFHREQVEAEAATPVRTL